MRYLKLVAVLLCLVCLTASCVAYADNAEEDYGAIQVLMSKAVTDPDEAEKNFKFIVNYYEGNASLKAYKNADYYYKYAKGRLKFAEGDFDNAYNDFYGLPDSFFEGVEVAYYLRFCEAMWDKQDAQDLNRVEDYEKAIESFKEAKELTEWPADCVEQIAECESMCGELIKKLAAECCSDGDHEKAQEYYQRMVEFENKSYSREGKKLLEACVKHSSFSISTPVIEYIGENTARISWDSTCKNVCLTVKQGKDVVVSEKLNDSFYDVANVAPGDKLFVTLEAVDIDLPPMEAELTVPKTVSVKAHYDDGMKAMEAGLYEEAYVHFEKAGSYEDSNLHEQFCKGMLCLAEADKDEEAMYLKWAKEHVEEAKKYFSVLENSGYEGADKLALYCSARISEYGKMYQPAIDNYYEVGDVLDSFERYMRLENRDYLPEIEPPAELPEKKAGVMGTVSKGVNVYSGPGNDYSKESEHKVHAEQEVNVIGVENNYYLIEVEQNGILYRVWCVKERIRTESGKVQKCGQESHKARVLIEAEVVYGPGTEYGKKEIVLARNTSVTVFDQEEEYSMIEYKVGEEKCRGWVLTEVLSK